MMERTYNLKQNPKPVQSTEPPKEDKDPLPWHHKVGDRIEFNHDGWDYKGVVKAANKKQAVILANREHFLREGQTFRKLEDWELCAGCGKFICACNSENQTNETEIMTPIKFSSLAAKESGDPISCIEGKLKYVNKIKTGKNDKGKWTIQTGVITADGLEQAYKIWNDEPVITEGDKGRILRLSSKEGAATGKGGLYMDLETWEKDGETKSKRVIKATGTAKIEFVGAAEEHTTETPQDRSEPPAGRGQPTPRSDAASSPRTQGNGHQVYLDTVDKKWTDKFRVMSRGRKIFKELKGKPDVDLPEEFSPSDWKEMSNSVEMGYKVGYHAYPIVFSRSPTTTGTSEAELAKLPNKEWEGDPPNQSTESPSEEEAASSMKTTRKVAGTEKVKTWKDVSHKSGVKLGEAPEADLKKWAKWAMTAKNKTGKQKPSGEAERFMLAMLEAATAHKWTAAKLFLENIGAHPKYEDGFSDLDLERFLECKVSKLSEDKAEELLARDLDEVVGEIMATIPEEQQAEDDSSKLPD